mmetsp:Transcript_44096/g.94500  ORF Transcript_44096/g.94500 Transcript_44096/m.94500 type:complete len:894 (+) Transcript_44096:1565-4246(+)
MVWEVSALPAAIQRKRWLFETKEAAEEFCLTSRATSQALASATSTQSLSSWDGKVDFSSLGSFQPRNIGSGTALSSSFGSGWSVATYEEGGVRFEEYDSEEAAREAYNSSKASKVMFDPEGLPVQCSTQFADKQGLGVASAILFRAGKSEADVAEAVRRGKAPFVPPDRSNFRQKAMAAVVDKLFCRSLVSYCSCISNPNRSLSHYDVAEFPGVRGFVALTIDDAPCMFDRPNSMILEVRDLLRQYEAKATFMLIGGLAEGHEDDLVALLQDGHELGNHGMVDRPYNEDPLEDFSSALDACNDQISLLQKRAGVAPEGARYFRAPHGKFTPEMERIVGERGMQNVMCDTYAACPIVQDGEFIGRSLAKSAQDGSILLIHMPSKGAREWCFTGLKTLLDGLKERNLQAVSVSELTARAEDGPIRTLRMQWMKEFGSGENGAGPHSRLNGLVEADFLKTRWSSLQPPAAVEKELLALAATTKKRSSAKIAVKVRTAGETRSLRFTDPMLAARWIHKHFVQEHVMVVPGQKSLNIADPLAPVPSPSTLGLLQPGPVDVDESQELFVAVAAGAGRTCGEDLLKPQRGDVITEVNGIRGDRKKMAELLSSSTQSLTVRLRRGNAYFRNISAIVSYGLPIAPGTLSTATAMSSKTRKELEDRLNGEVLEQALLEVEQRVARAAVAIAALKISDPPATWHASIKDACCDFVADALLDNVCGAAKLKIAKVLNFTSRDRAANFLQAFCGWCALQVEEALLDGRIETAIRDTLQSWGVEVNTLAVGGWLEETGTDLTFLETVGQRHGKGRRVVGALGTIISLGAWSAARHWSKGEEEFRWGHELSEEFFREIGIDTVKAVAQAHQARIHKMLDDPTQKSENPIPAEVGLKTELATTSRMSQL